MKLTLRHVEETYTVEYGWIIVYRAEWHKINWSGKPVFSHDKSHKSSDTSLKE